MYQQFLQELESYSKKAIDTVKSIMDIGNITLDHVCYQTTSKKDFKKVIKMLDDNIDIEAKIPHSGRMIAVGLLTRSITVNGVDIKRIEISEPKPMRSIPKRNFDHISFLTKQNFDDVLLHLKNQGHTLSEVKQIGDHRFVKIVKNGIEIELRNKSLGKPFQEEDSKEIGEGMTQMKRRESISDERDTRVKELEENLELEHQKTLRALADYQNLQKRVEEQKKMSQDTTNLSVLGQILDILDDFDRVLENLPIEEKDQVGIRLLREKIQKIIDGNGIAEIKCFEGDSLDPHIHEAVGVIAVSDDKEHENIKQIVQKGYKIKESGEVVRPVRVIVGKKGE